MDIRKKIVKCLACGKSDKLEGILYDIIANGNASGHITEIEIDDFLEKLFELRVEELSRLGAAWVISATVDPLSLQKRMAVYAKNFLDN